MEKRAPDPCEHPSIITSTRVEGKRPQRTGLEPGSYTNSQPSQAFQVARVCGAGANRLHCPWPVFPRSHCPLASLLPAGPSWE